MNIEITKEALDFLPKGSYDMETSFEMHVAAEAGGGTGNAAPYYVFATSGGGIVFRLADGHYSIQEKTGAADLAIRRFADFCRRHHVAFTPVGF